MGQMTALPNPFTSAIDALIFDLSVASAANPTELNAIGTVAGDLRLVHPTTATSDSATWYRLDASTDSVSAPYIMASATAGLRWIAIAGTYEQGGQNVSGAIVSTSTITGTQLISNIAIGTAPLVVTSTTVVANLNCSTLMGNTWASPGAIGGTAPGSGAFTTISATGQITSTLATGTAPFVVASSTVVANLNVSQLLGQTWANPGAIGGTTPGTGAFTTISATGVITSTLATGTAPFVVTSTTVVGNLNVSQLLGQTWANPGAIGGTTPATTIALSGILTSTNTTSATTSLLGAVVIGNGTAATSVALGGGIVWAGTGFSVGAAATASTPINVSVSQNLGTEIQISNTNVGSAASAQLWATNGTSNLQLGKLGTGYTTSGVLVANTGILYDSGAAGLAIIANSGQIVFAAGGTTQCAAFSSAGLFTSSIAAANTFTVTSTGASSFIVATDTGTAATAGFIANGDATGFSTYKYQLAGVNKLQHYFTGTSWTFNDIVNNWNPIVYTAGATAAGVFTFAGTLAATSSTAASVKFAGGVAINAGLWISSATMISTSTSFTNGAAANVGTLSNAPAVGNPTKWIPINDNGTTRYIPAW